MDAIIISDLHLGSSVCQTAALLDLLQNIHSGKLVSEKLILNGDVFDSWDFRRLKKKHWKILSIIRRLSDRMEIIWINGNHDGPAEIISHLLGVCVKDQEIIESGNKKIMILHGDKFDDFIAEYPVTTFFADCIYRFMQIIDSSFWMARTAKRTSKTFLKCVERVKQGAIEYALKNNCSAVCVGHTHHAESIWSKDVQYLNCGCWTELPANYVTVENGVLEIKEVMG